MNEHSAYRVDFGLHALDTPARATGSDARPKPRHLKITGAAPAYGYERCEDAGCAVEPDGTASSCGRLACPACGCGGTNLTTMELIVDDAAARVRCSCGFAWVREHAGHTLSGLPHPA
jgi:hypothetical protein